MTLYRHRQFAATMVGILAVFAVGALVVTAQTPARNVGYLVAGVLAAAGIVFSSLTIEITDRQLRWKFGPGLIRKQVPLAEIAECDVTRTRFWEGWGIHLTSRGWLYNVSGFDAVQVRTRTGRQFLLGTDEAEKLAATLRRHLA